MKPIYHETVSVVASDLENTTWTELYELWETATKNGEHPDLVAEFARLTNEAKKLHDDIVKLSKFFPPEVE